MTHDELIGLTEARYLGTPERTDALLDECNGLVAELGATSTWRPFRRWRLQRDLASYVEELRHNERIRLERDARNPGLETTHR